MAWHRRHDPLRRTLFLLLGAGLFVSGIVILAQDDAIGRRPGQAIATVTDVAAGPRSPTLVTVEFRSPDGDLHTAEVFHEGALVGDELTIEYDRDRPSVARVKDSDHQFVLALVALPVGAYLLLLSLVGERRSHPSST